MQPVTLDAILELDLEKAFAKLDLEEIKRMFIEQQRKADDSRDEADNAASERDGMEASLKEAEENLETTDKEKDEIQSKWDKLNGRMDSIYDIVKPFIDKKTRVQVLKEIFEIASVEDK